MYFSYFVLFARFFYVTYLSPNARKGKRSFKGDASDRIETRRPIAADGSHKIKDQ